MKKHIKKIITASILATMSISFLPSNIMVFATEGKQKEAYEIYPNPQSMNYTGGDFQLSKNVNVVYDEGVDEYTKKRVNEVLKSQNLEATVSNQIVDGKTNFIVGINESGGVVDQYFNQNVSHDEVFFDEKMDSHLVSVKDGVIGVLGEDADSAFYGVTTMKHVFNQLGEDDVIQGFRVDDYAEVADRGFIEGYYGNPWSNEDRAELMKFGGDYKLNQYVFAPKDDVYHNSKWRELYPEAELAEIRKLAQVGNETKNRYVYALHPFMHNPVRFDTEENYQADLNVIKEKFTQLLENDVRQFAILADDAGAPPQGASMYVKLLTDLTRWLEEQKVTYTDLKTDMLFCPSDYMGNGGSEQLKELNKAEDNISIVMTGGRIWGEVDENFATNFMNNIATEGNPGRAPFFWINWPCSDNSKQHLIMGGNDTFLHPGVDPSKIDGIVLNPMQQAEANKSALFAVADYAWNVWDNKEQADQNWHDSFKYMDHGSAAETNSSLALREISKHMINQNMDGRVRPLQESIELAPKLKAFKDKYEAGLSIKADALDLIEEFTNLKNAADYYKNNPGNPRTRDQIIHWLNCWEDTTDAAISYLKSAIAVEEGDDDAAWVNYSAGQASFEKSKTYGFHYVDHTQYAEVGVQHIVPFLRTIGESLSAVVGSIIDPNKVYATYITNREDTPSGDKDNIFDGNAGTELVYKNPNSVEAGTYVGIKYSNPITLNTVEFLMGANGNSNDTMQKAKIQYTVDGKEWIDLEEGKEYSMPNEVKVEGLDLKVKGVRLIATESRSNTWLGVRDINVNKKDIEEPEAEMNPTLMRSDAWQVYQGDEANLTDGKDNTDVWYKTANHDTSLAGEFIGLDLGKVAKLDEIRFVLGRNGSGDKWRKYRLEYSVDNETWTTIKDYDNSSNPNGQDIVHETFETPIEAKYVRVTNLENINKWVIFSELSVVSEDEANKGKKDNIYTNTTQDIYSVATESSTKLKPMNGIELNSGEYIGVKLDRIKDLKNINFELSNNEGLVLQSSLNGVEWTNIENTSQLEDGRYVRVINNSANTVVFDLTAFEVLSNEVSEPMLVDAYAEEHNPEYAFDGDLRTKATFHNYPQAGDSIVYDLGQEILVDNLKYVVLDTEKDHLRDGKIQLSLDGENWTDAITIGDGVENSGDNKDSRPVDNGYKHGNQSGGVVTIDSAYLEGENLNQKARYARILFTAPYNHRWMVINELMINNGEYIPTVNDPTYISNPIEERGFTPSNLRDGNLTTSYKPDNKDGEITEGHLTYRLSEKTNVRKVTIVQDGSSISNATVKARVGADEWVELGTLSNSLNEFINRDHENIFEIKVEWNGVVPNIYELITLNDEFEFPVSDSLKSKYDALMALNSEDYTISSYAILAEELESAKAILDDKNASQKKIDKALEKLVAVESLLIERAKDFEAFDKALEIANNLKEEDHTKGSWSQLVGNLAEANELNSNKGDYTQEQVNTVLDTLNNSMNSLVNISGLKNAIDESNAILNGENNYTEDSLKVLESAVAKGQAVVNNDAATAKEVEDALLLINNAKDALVEKEPEVVAPDKSALQAKYEELSSMEEDKYTVSSFEALEEALESSKTVLDNADATQEEINNALSSLTVAENGLLVRATDLTKLEAIISEIEELEEDNYTESTWEALTKQLEEAKEAYEDKDDYTQEQIDKVVSTLEGAKNSLVDLSPLKEAIEEANEILDGDKDYTDESVENLEAAIEAAEELLEKEDATQKELDQAKMNLAKAIADLEEEEEEDDSEDIVENENVIEKIENPDGENEFVVKGDSNNVRVVIKDMNSILNGEGSLEVKFGNSSINIPFEAIDKTLIDENSVLMLDVKVNEDKSLTSKIKGLNNVYELNLIVKNGDKEEKINNFDEEITVKIDISSEGLEGLDMDELNAYAYTNGEFEKKDSSVEDNIVTFETESLGNFVIAEEVIEEGNGGSLPNTGGVSSSIPMAMGTIMLLSGAFVIARKRKIQE